MLDLNTYQFTIFEERLSKLKNPNSEITNFAEEIKKADAILIVTPEYNGGYPASLKNVIDLLYTEWKRKPIAIATVSSGAFGGSQVITSLLFTLWKIGAWVTPSMFPVSNIEKLLMQKVCQLKKNLQINEPKFLWMNLFGVQRQNKKWNSLLCKFIKRCIKLFFAFSNYNRSNSISNNICNCTRSTHKFIYT